VAPKAAVKAPLRQAPEEAPEAAGPPHASAPTQQDNARQLKREFILALKAGDLPAVVRCLNAGSSIEQRSMWNNTPLIVACHYGHQAVAMELLKRGANPVAVNEQGCTPLLFSCVEGLTEVVNLLLQSQAVLDGGLEPSAATVYSRRLDHSAPRTPLTAAAENGFLDCVQRLLERNVKPSPEALLVAAAQGEVEVVRTLLGAWGSDAYSERAAASGEALVIATRKSHVDTVEALLTVASPSGESVRAALTAATKDAGQREMLVRMLCRAGAPTNESDAEGNSPLHVAARSGWDAVVDLFLCHGANPTQLNTAGESASDVAMSFGHIDLCEKLKHACQSSSGPDAVGGAVT